MKWGSFLKFNFNLVSTPLQENIHFFQPCVFTLVWLIYPGKAKKRKSGKEKTSLWVHCKIKLQPKLRHTKLLQLNLLRLNYFFALYKFSSQSSLSLKQKMKRVWMELNRAWNLVGLSSNYFVKISSLRCGHSIKISTKFCRKKLPIVYFHTKFLITWIRGVAVSKQAVFCWWMHQIVWSIWTWATSAWGNFCVTKFLTTRISTEITVNVTAA